MTPRGNKPLTSRFGCEIIVRAALLSSLRTTNGGRARYLRGNCEITGISRGDARTVTRLQRGDRPIDRGRETPAACSRDRGVMPAPTANNDGSRILERRFTNVRILGTRTLSFVLVIPFSSRCCSLWSIYLDTDRRTLEDSSFPDSSPLCDSRGE